MILEQLSRAHALAEDLRRCREAIDVVGRTSEIRLYHQPQYGDARTVCLTADSRLKPLLTRALEDYAKGIRAELAVLGVEMPS